MARRGRRARAGATSAWLLLGALLGSPAARATDLVVTAAVDGQLATLDCGERPRPAPFVAAAARLRGEPGALALDAGGLVGASGISRIAVERDAGAVASAIVAAGYRALAVDHRDLATPTLSTLAPLLAERGVPYVLTNLRCESRPDAKAALPCGALVKDGDAPLLFDGPEGPTAFLAAMAPAWLSRMARDRTVGLSLIDPAEAVGRAAREARRRGARHVVLAWDGDRAGPIDQVLALVQALPPDGRPDVVLASRLPSGARSVQLEPRLGGALLLALRADEPLVIALGRGGPDGASMARARPAAQGEAPPEVVSLAEALREHLCGTLRAPLGGARIGHALDRDGLAMLLLDVLRENQRAEVGLINRSAVRELPVYPVADGALTELVVRAALPYEDVTRKAFIKGADLRALVGSPRGDALYVRGVSGRGGEARVNGRKLDDNALYRVVTTGYLAEGGDPGIADKLTLRAEVGPALSRALLDWLRTAPRGATVHRPVDPAERTRWTLRGSFDAAFTSINLTNDAKYTDPQLTRAESTALRFDLDVGADAERPDLLFYNQLRGTWAVARTVTAGKDTGFVETADLIFARSQLVVRPAPLRRWFLPVPFVELYTETEIQPPPTRDFRHLELRPAAGLRFLLADRFSLYGAFALDVDVFNPRSDFAPAWMLGWNLVSGPLFRVGGRAIEAQSTCDLVYRDPSIRPELLVRVGAKVVIPVISVVSLTVGYDLFARRSGGDPWGASGSALLGLHIGGSRTLQSFRF